MAEITTTKCLVIAIWCAVAIVSFYNKPEQSDKKDKGETQETWIER